MQDDLKGLDMQSSGGQQSGKVEYRGRKYIKPAFAGFMTVLFLILTFLIISSEDDIEVEPLLSGYWTANHSWELKATLNKIDEGLAVGKTGQVEALINVSKGPLQHQKGFKGRINIRNNHSEEILVKTMNLSVYKPGDLSDPVSEIPVAVGDNLKPGQERTYYFRNGVDLAGYNYSVKTSVIFEKNLQEQTLNQRTDIIVPRKPEIANDRINVRGPGLLTTKGVTTDYKEYRRTFTGNSSDRQVFKIKPVDRNDFYASFNYSIAETGQKVSFTEKFAVR